MKAYDTAAMAAAVAPHLAPDGVLVSLQNGLGNLEAAARAVGAERVLGGARHLRRRDASSRGGCASRSTPSRSSIGSPDARDARRGAAAAALGGARSRRRASRRSRRERIVAELWAKVLYNAALNPLGALLGVPTARSPPIPTRARSWTTSSTRRSRSRAPTGVRAPLARRGGVPRASSTGGWCRRPPAHRSSMLQDIERGRPTEIDAING